MPFPQEEASHCWPRLPSPVAGAPRCRLSTRPRHCWAAAWTVSSVPVFASTPVLESTPARRRRLRRRAASGQTGGHGEAQGGAKDQLPCSESMISHEYPLLHYRCVTGGTDIHTEQVAEMVRSSRLAASGGPGSIGALCRPIRNVIGRSRIVHLPAGPSDWRHQTDAIRGERAAPRRGKSLESFYTRPILGATPSVLLTNDKEASCQ